MTRSSRSAAMVVAGALLVSLGWSATAAGAPIETSGSAEVRAVRIGNQVSTKPRPPSPSASYRVTIISEWTSSSHPATLPPNSHISPTVVVNHGAPGDLFVVGAPASPGIERMAETGATSTLRTELGSNPTVSDVGVGRSIYGAGQDSFEVTAGSGDDLISLVTMLAPSPDWFVGVRDVDLLGSAGWVDRVELDLGNYDAGTDSGTGFTSPNSDTTPAQVIGAPRDAAFAQAAAEGRFGRVVIERIS